MTIKTIGFGATKNTANYNSLKVYFEAELQSGESVDVCMDALRALVAAELGLDDEFSTLRAQVRDRKLELVRLLSAIDTAKSEIENATNQWNNLVQYFLRSDLPDIGDILAGVDIAPQINFDEIDDDGNDDYDDELPFEPRSF